MVLLAVMACLGRGAEVDRRQYRATGRPLRPTAGQCDGYHAVDATRPGSRASLATALDQRAPLQAARLMPETTLLIATTPLTVLAGAAVALAQGGKWHLVLIEDFPHASDWLRLLAHWRDCPFSEVETLPGRATEARAATAVAGSGLVRRWARQSIKRDQRRVTFTRLRAIDAALAPARIMVGNDRRPETQFALHLASSRRNARSGSYLDDGLFSYVGDVHTRPLARTLIDAPLKRLVWGRWWQSLPLVGTSRWIDEAWLALPQRALDQSPTRIRRALPQAACRSRALSRLAVLAWRQFGGARPAPRLHRVLALPHSNLLVREPDAVARLREQLAQCSARGETLAVKYHPRELQADPLTLENAGAYLLPTAIAFELLLPLLVHGGSVFGQASTALLAARWLRPDLQVFDAGGQGGMFARRAAEFLASTGVRPATPDLALPGSGPPAV
jgi:hypothetical protein